MTSKLVLFQVEGPFEIPFRSPGAGLSKRIDKNHGQEFWLSLTAAPFANAVGCYVFGLKAGRGYTPWYVGKTTKGFQQEVFQPHKVQKYNQVVFDGHKGTPVIWFVVRPGKKSLAGAKQIDEVESYLIQAAYQKNPELTNKQKIAGPPWGIRGVLRGGRGKPLTTQQFKGMMGLAVPVRRLKSERYESEDVSTQLVETVQDVSDAVEQVGDASTISTGPLVATES